jgi:ribonuclease P protein component
VNGSVHTSGSEATSAAMRAGFRFPRTAKLLKHPAFERVYKQGQRHFSGLMTVFFLGHESAAHQDRGKSPRTVLENQATGPRIGLTVSRALGGSVERNRIRRRMREAVRLNLSRLNAPVDVVINPKKIVLKADFPELVSEVRRAFEKIEKKVNSNE